MKRLSPRPLDADSFRPFGEVIEPDNCAEIRLINNGTTTRFHDIAAAKAYIINTSAADAIESGHLTYEVLDSVTYQVAIRAYQSGEFYLDAPPPDRRALRSK